MRKLFLLVIVAFAPAVINAQYYWDYGVSTGAANYLGEMGGKQLTRRDFVSDMKLQETRSSVGVFARYKIAQQFSVKASFNYANIRGDDALSTNPARHYRNLSFSNNLWELNAQCQWFFYEVNDLGHTYRYKDNFRAYIALGAGGMYHNPRAKYNGEWVDLRPLMTEDHKYTTITMTIPASAGFYFTINKHYRIGWEFCWRTTFTDYLDDASTHYVDKSGDPNPLASIMADRTDHAAANAWGAAQNPPQPGFGNNFGYHVWYDDQGNAHFNKRGDSTHNDSFMTTDVEFSYVFRGKSSLYRSHYSSIFKGKKYKHRKVRAKF
ncbi:MAG: outer membrane beta-barrel protein [Bacteroidetes bacterium]|nr:outer membrane beta-barrel protein [Bacteroidota bacterium]